MLLGNITREIYRKIERKRKPNMEWHSNLIRPNFVPRSAESSFNFLFNCNNLESFQGLDVKQPEIMMAAGAHMGVVPPMERSGGYGGGGGGSMDSCLSSHLLLGDKKKRLTSEQLDSLENSFQEEIKLEPERKMKLARELGLQPRQVAVWFQNRRARWKTKQLERLYDSLKLEFDAVSREKQKLQDEVMKLRAMLIEQAKRSNHNTKQVSIGCTDVSGGNETVESTSAAAMCGGQEISAVAQQQQQPQQNGVAECHNYMFSGIEEYNTLVSPPLAPYWAALPTTYPC